VDKRNHEKMFRNVRVVCRNTVKACDFCKDEMFSEGFCKMCKRPLWENPGCTCNTIIGYYDGNYKEVLEQKQGNDIMSVHFICRACNSITTRNLTRR